MRTLLLLIASLFCVSGGTGCTYALVNSSTRYVSLEPTTPRNEVIKQLGVPHQSKSFNPPVAGESFAAASVALHNARVSLYDEYRLSGLVFTPDYNPYLGFGEGYTLGMYLTLGLGEIIYFPYCSADLAARGSRRYRLRLWYDGSGKLIAEENRPEQHAPEPNQALQRTLASSRR